MRKINCRPLVYVGVLIAAVVFGVKHFHISDFRVIAPNTLYVSGQPRGMDYTRLLYKYHISTIVNVRFPSEHRNQNWYNEEMTWVRANAVRYVELPIDKKNYIPDEQTQNTFLELMSRRDNLPVLLHGSGDDERVALLAAAWLRKTRGCSPEETARQVRKIIEDRPLTKQEIDFITSLK
jgi:protein tyrosine/serine phosphatase